MVRVACCEWRVIWRTRRKLIRLSEVTPVGMAVPVSAGRMRANVRLASAKARANSGLKFSSARLKISMADSVELESE